MAKTQKAKKVRRMKVYVVWDASGIVDEGYIYGVCATRKAAEKLQKETYAMDIVECELLEEE